MRLEPIVAAVCLLCVSLSSAAGGQFTTHFQASHEHEDRIEKARLVTIATEVLQDEGYDLEIQDEEAGSVTTDWLTLARLRTAVSPSQVRFSLPRQGNIQTQITVSLATDKKTLRLRMTGRDRRGLEVVPGSEKEKAEKILALIVEKLQEPG